MTAQEKSAASALFSWLSGHEQQLLADRQARGWIQPSFQATRMHTNSTPTGRSEPSARAPCCRSWRVPSRPPRIMKTAPIRGWPGWRQRRGRREISCLDIIGRRGRLMRLNTDLSAAGHRTRGGRFWLIAAIAVITIAGTVSLGVWQLDRARAEGDLPGRLEARRSHARRSMPQALLAWRPPRRTLHRPVRLRGTVADTATRSSSTTGRCTIWRAFTSSRRSSSMPPVDVCMVQRGWVARNFSDSGPAAAGARRRRRWSRCGKSRHRRHIAGPGRLYGSSAPGRGVFAHPAESRPGRVRAETGLALLPLAVVAADRRERPTVCSATGRRPRAVLKDTTATRSSGSGHRRAHRIPLCLVPIIVPYRRARLASRG